MKHAGTWKLQSRLHACVLPLRPRLKAWPDHHIRPTHQRTSVLHACVLPLRPLNDRRSRLFGTASLIRVRIARVFIASVLTAPAIAVPTAIPRVGDTRRPRATARGAFLLFLLRGVVATGSGVHRREAGAGGWIQGGGHFCRARDPIFGSGDPISRSRDPISRSRDPIFGSGDPISRSRAPISGSGDPISRSRDLGYRVTPPPVGSFTHILMPGAARPLRVVLASMPSSGQ